MTRKTWLFLTVFAVASIGNMVEAQWGRFTRVQPAQQTTQQRAPQTTQQRTQQQPAQQAARQSASPVQATPTQAPPMTSGKALLALLDPRSKSLKNATGNHLMRRISLLDDVPDKDIQIAFVIDGTDSMGMELDSVKDVLLTLVTLAKDRQSVGREIAFSLVVYRDTGAERLGGEILVPTTEFTTDLEKFCKTVGEIKPETGVPYFEESVDLGVYRALDELEWTVDDKTERWIFLIGDAPPYPEGMNDGKGARRSHPTQTLLDMAGEKGVKINPIICSSGFLETNTATQKQLKDTYTKLLPKTRDFFNALGKGTNGHALIDLSDPLVIETLAKCLEAPQEVAIAKILPAEVQERKADWNRFNGDMPPVRVAVVTTGELTDNNADVFVPICETLKKIPNIDLVDMETIFQFVSMKNRDMSELDADWCITASRNGARIIMSLASQNDDALTFSESFSRTPAANTVQQMLGSLFDQLVEKDPESDLGQVYRKSKEHLDFTSSWSNEVRVCRMISQAILKMDIALVYANDGEQSDEVRAALDDAVKYLNAGLRIEPENPYVHSLLANCYYNQTSASVLVSDSDRTESVAMNKDTALFSLVTKHAKLAFDNRSKCNEDFVRQEVEGDYYLFTGQYDQAIQTYGELIEDYPRHQNRDALLRAHWALAGIYAGDWGAESIRDLGKSRDHVVSIFSIDLDSQQGRYFVKTLEYSEDDGSRHSSIAMNHSHLLSHDDN